MPRIKIIKLKYNQNLFYFNIKAIKFIITLTSFAKKLKNIKN